MQILKDIKRKPFTFGNWILFFILAFLGLRGFLNTNILAFVSIDNLLQSKRFLVYLVVCVILLVAWLSFSLEKVRARIERISQKLQTVPRLLKVFLSFVLILLPGLIRWIFPLPPDFNLNAWMMIFLFYCAALFVSSLFGDLKNLKHRVLLLAILTMAGGFGYAFFGRMNQVTSYPFPTYWSEGNRFFDYSTLFGSFRYIFPPGEKIQAFVNWGMALPWAIPFVLPRISIGFYRFWYQLVWILPAMFLGYLSINKSKNQENIHLIAFAFALWSFLFIDQGPIYPPLVIGAIITIIAVRKRLPVGMVLIAVASYYVRSARWTWAYAPGLWAGMLALLAIKNPSLKKQEFRLLIKPIALGLSGYFGGHLLPQIIRLINRGANLRLLPDPTASTSRQPLLWNRLWPNPTYTPGIVPGLLWAVLPVCVFIITAIIKKRWKVNWLQNLSSALVASAFLAVGIIASTKIGGGSNLHNLDMFLITALFLLSESLNAIFRNNTPTNQNQWIFVLLGVLLILSPATYALRQIKRLELPLEEKITESFSAVSNKVEEYSTKGEILFIDHRQLLAFNLVENVPLIDEYEKKYLMDNALAANSDYFNAFYRDLDAQRFKLIVNEPLNLISRGEDYAFGEENDAYVKWVTTPLFCKYEPIYTSQATALELLIPRIDPPPSHLNCQAYFSNSNE